MVVSSAALFYIEQHVQILAWNPSTVNSFVARSEAPVRREKVGGDLTQGTTSNGYSVPPVERAVRLLCYLGAGNTCRNLSTASRDLNINRTTLLRLIHTLLNLSMIEELGDGAGYRLGVGLVSLGAQALEGRDLVRACQPVLQSLCERTAMSAHLGILDGLDVVYLARATPSSRLVSNIRVGARLRAHAASIGRAILAEMSEADVSALLASAPLEAVTSKTPTELAAVLAQARDDKAKGYAWSVGNFEAGIGSCAAAIFDHGGQVVAALNVSGPEVRYTDPGGSPEIRDAVCGAAAQASALLGSPR